MSAVGSLVIFSLEWVLLVTFCEDDILWALEQCVPCWPPPAVSGLLWAWPTTRSCTNPSTSSRHWASSLPSSGKSSSPSLSFSLYLPSLSLSLLYFSFFLSTLSLSLYLHISFSLPLHFDLSSLYH